MNTSAFNGFVGKKLSVATTKQKADGTPEIYIGFLEEVGDDYIILDYARATPNRSNAISRVIHLSSTVVGVWVNE